MAGRGPAPKRSGRQRRNKRPELAEVRALPDRPVPDPPAGLLAQSKDAWMALWRSDVAQVIDLDSDRPALERLFGLYDERIRCMRLVEKAGRMVEGSQGQPVLNPAYAQVGKLDAEIRALEGQFGLTPMARLRLGVKFGQAARSLDDLNRMAAGDLEDPPDPRVVDVEVVSDGDSDSGASTG